MKIEFLIPGVPTDAFYSQIAMFRLGLDSLGDPYRQARLVLCLAGPHAAPVPARWRPYLGRVDVLWAPPEIHRRDGHAGLFRYEVLDPASDLTILCDADTLMLRPFDAAALLEFVRRPAVRGVIAHGPPPLIDDSGRDHSTRGSGWFWHHIAEQTLGRTLPLDHAYTLRDGQDPCPFYLNYGAVIATPELFRRVRDELTRVMPRARTVLANEFICQIGLALGCAAAGVPCEALPMRYNFPNDPVADARYPDELEHVVLMHYLRLQRFDRHRIFASAAAFTEFLGLRLEGSNRVFQQRVREISGGAYPFP